MEEKLRLLPELSAEKKEENIKFFKKLKKRTPKRLDVITQEIHEKVFQHTDCLSCGNCCKRISPFFTDRDIKRIAKHLRMKEFEFITQYLHRDEDDYWVLNEMPCPFLGSDNYCFIYDVRPKACGEYPHTDRRKFIQLADLTIKNIEVCPAVYEIVEGLKEKIKV